MTRLEPDPAGGHRYVRLRRDRLQALQEREHQLAETQRLAHVGGWAWDIASGEVTWSDELYRIFGFTPQEFTPSYDAFFSRIDAAHRARSEAEVQAALAERRPCVYEYSTTRPDGSQHWLRALCMVDVDGAGTATRMYGTAQDITDFQWVERGDPELGDGQGRKREFETEAEHGQADQELERAFAAGELVLHYQPKVALISDHIVGVEALLRWDHPGRGMVAPYEFIGLAERSGLIVPIGTWVIEEGCRQVARWQASFPDRPALVVSVNVSARQFSPELVDVVAAALAASGVEPATLCLEITESALMEDSEQAVVILRALAELGVEVSIDDFGTGFSSLARLRNFPLDELKIDKSFIDHVGGDATAIVASVIAMAHALKLRVVAEGVETAEQLQRLRIMGCDEVQGYHFARPGPASAIDELLKDEGSASWRQHAEREPSPGPGTATYRPDRILVIDDTADVRELAIMALAAAGFEVHEAVDGAGALAAAKLLAPDCILLDLVMPGVSGVEVCRALRADPATADCTIVIMTSMDKGADKAEAFSNGADDYIVKPFSPRDLASRAQSAMRRRRASSTTVDGAVTVTEVRERIAPLDEEARIDALRRYHILDTPPDAAFDRITALAARLFDVPIAIVSIVDTDRIWFKSHHGLPDVSETARDPGLCASVILQDRPWVVTDAARDPRTLANPLVAGDFGLRFYAGAPLTTSDGHKLGTLCVIDKAPRQVTPSEVANLADLAAMVMDELELPLTARRAVNAATAAPGK